jgi:large subunit ribosomal protein L35|tara:strand:+ start:10124 stop:10327 length:204 start_codon:yes stop_codon:yes gene_type:complete
MPKLKTNSSAKKRFKVTKSGQIKAKHSFTSHNLGNKNRKRKRLNSGSTILSETNRSNILRHKLPYNN